MSDNLLVKNVIILKDSFEIEIWVTQEYVDKLAGKTPPMTLDIVEKVLRNPDSVLKSNNVNQNDHRCYYLSLDKTMKRYYKVVVKYLKQNNEHWLVTAHVTNKPKETEAFDYEDDL